MKSCKKNILFAFLLLISALVFAQPVETKTYGIANPEADTIAYYGNSFNTFKPFFKSFKAMVVGGKKQINILHIGDSHLQADLLTGQARKNFQSFLYGLEGGRGMVTPFMKGCPDSYKLSFSSGWTSMNILSNSDSQHKSIWGTTVYTTASNQSITIKVNYKNPIKYDFNTFRVYHSELKEGESLVVDDMNVGYSKKYNQKGGYTEFKLSDYVSEITIQINKNTSSKFYIYGFYFNNNEGGVVYNVTGTNGVAANHYNSASLFQTHLASLPTDLVIISLGTNDTYESTDNFETNLTQLINTIRNTHKDIPILLVTPSENWWHKKKPNPRMKETENIIISVAKKTDCAVMNMYQILGGAGSAQKMKQKGLMQSDYVHMTAQGYNLQGDLLYNALWRDIENNLSK